MDSLTISSNHFKYLLPGYRQRLDEIQLALDEIQLTIKALQQERREINEIINIIDTESLNSKLSNNQNQQEEYNEKSTWLIKALYILKKEKRPLTTAEIVSEILHYEPTMDRILAIKNISSVLGSKSNEGRYVERYLKEGKDQKFGLILNKPDLTGL